MKCLVAGGTGFIGTKLVAALRRGGHEVTVLSLRSAPKLSGLGQIDAVFNLSGEPVDQRWTNEAKARIRNSRVLGTKSLVDAMCKLSPLPRMFICASAVGYYGDRGDEVLTESSAPAKGFLPEVCTAWEQAAFAATTQGIRTVTLRTGIVLGSDGGALKKMVPAFRAFAGGKLGSGRQWMPWLHIDDMVGLYLAAMDERYSGPINATAPSPARNDRFTQELARVLHRPGFLSVPEAALHAIFGDMAQILLSSQRAVPEAASKQGFEWKFPGLGAALENLLN